MMTLARMASDALAVQGACNLSGVIHSFSRLLPDLRAHLEAEGSFSTDKLNMHPICVMYATQIAYLTNVSSFANADVWAEANAWCEANKE